MNSYENKTFSKLSTIQIKLKAPKGQYNSFGKYSYRNCEDILEAIKPLLSEVKATLLLSDVIEQIGDRYYVKATASFIDMEEYGQRIDVTAFAREEESKKGMDGSQVTGAASSYARKYALNGLFAIDDTKDSDSTNQHGKGEIIERTKTQTKAPDKQKAQSFDSSKMAKVLQNSAKGLGMTDEELLSFAEAEYKVATLKQLTREQGLALLSTMKQYPKKEVE